MPNHHFTVLEARVRSMLVCLRYVNFQLEAMVRLVKAGTAAVVGCMTGRYDVFAAPCFAKNKEPVLLLSIGHPVFPNLSHMRLVEFFFFCFVFVESLMLCH